VTTVLVDHNMEGQAARLWSTLASDGWLKLEPLELVTFARVGLPAASTDRLVWRFAQSQRMILLTNNRNARDADSLWRTILEESTSTSLPVLTVGDIDRMVELEYGQRSAERLVEISLYLENCLGTGRMFIP
jgi:hypothetical protein